MHIILIGYLHNLGGIQTHSHWLAKGLVERGHSVEILTPAPLRDDADGLPENPSYDVAEYKTLRDIMTLGRKTRPQPVAVIVTGTGWKAMLLAYAIKRAWRRVFFEVMSGERNGFLDPRILSRFGFDAIVGQGSGVERKFIREFGWHGPSTVIPALPEPLEIACTIPTAPALPHSTGGKLRLGYFSRLVGYKGAGFLIDNWDQLAQHADSLDIWGTGPAHDDFAQAIVNAGLGDRITLKGRYPGGQEYVELLQRYDLTLLPTWGKEGAPLVLLESMACGIPFVANGVGGIPDYANPYCRITTGDIAEFLPLYDDLAGKIRRGEIDTVKLQEHYHTNFSYGRLVDRWEQFLLRALPGTLQGHA